MTPLRHSSRHRVRQLSVVEGGLKLYRIGGEEDIRLANTA
jgi:hypothetical protein